MLRLLLLMVSVTWLHTTVQGQMLGLYEGDICRQDGETLWTCKRARECPQAAKDLRAGKKPELCSFDGKDPIVCCEPKVKAAITRGAIARAKCEEYAKSVFERHEKPVEDGFFYIDRCASDVEPLIIFGQDAKPKEYPHMALVGWGPKAKKEWVCGGSLVSERFVLSAAHCSHTVKASAQWVRLGEYNLKSDQDEKKDGTARPQDFEIIEIIDHPNYKEPSLYYDITLYKLDRDVEFDEFVRPICLSTRHRFHKDVAIATGWGKTSHGGSGMHDILQKANITLIARMDCETKCNTTQVYRDQIKDGVKDQTQLCAGNGLDGDTCGGDSGGPLQLRLRDPYCMYELIGVTSFGYVCGGMTPAIYTRVSHFVPWIESVVWPNVTLTSHA